MTVELSQTAERLLKIAKLRNSTYWQGVIDTRAALGLEGMDDSELVFALSRAQRDRATARRQLARVRLRNMAAGATVLLLAGLVVSTPLLLLGRLSPAVVGALCFAVVLALLEVVTRIPRLAATAIAWEAESRALRDDVESLTYTLDRGRARLAKIRT